MDTMIRSLVRFLAILNPFALSLYLANVMENLDRRGFARVLAGACAISLAAFLLFGLTGEGLLVDWLGVRPEALRIFGGIVFFVVGYDYIVKGYRAVEALRGSLEHLPSAIALPFMIGAGTITQAILVGKRHTPDATLAILGTGMGITFCVVYAFKLVRDRLRGAREKVFDRYANILARANGLLIGAISAEMVVSGVRRLWKLS